MFKEVEILSNRLTADIAFVSVNPLSDNIATFSKTYGFETVSRRGRKGH